MILIYTPEASPRLEYTAEVIFRWVLKMKVPFSITTDPEEYREFHGRKINYSELADGQGLHVPVSGFLSQQGIKPAFPGLTHGDYGKALFPVDGSKDFTYDVFAAVFYMVSRYEEYLPHQKDQHGRYKAENSLAYQQNFLDKPMVHYWAEELKDKLMFRYPEYKFPAKKFRALATIDVDNGYAYVGKRGLRLVGGYGRDLLKGRFRSMEERTHVLTGNKKDPFDYYKFQKRTCEAAGVPLRYFILCGKGSEHDHNLDTESRTFRKLVKKLCRCGKIGLHPSYHSCNNPDLIWKERELLKNLSGKKLLASRQHFLRMQLPETYRHLLSAGILQDYSMGYPDHPGFRAGLAEPFPFYDVEQEHRTPLIIHPFVVMETSYRDYMKLKPEDALVHITGLLEEVKKVSGRFIYIWHDRSFAPWPEYQGWKEVFEALTLKAAAG